MQSLCTQRPIENRFAVNMKASFFIYSSLQFVLQLSSFYIYVNFYSFILGNRNYLSGFCGVIPSLSMLWRAYSNTKHSYIKRFLHNHIQKLELSLTLSEHSLQHFRLSTVLKNLNCNHFGHTHGKCTNKQTTMGFCSTVAKTQATYIGKLLRTSL